jgi:hypothetical protein
MHSCQGASVFQIVESSMMSSSLQHGELPFFVTKYKRWRAPE